MGSDDWLMLTVAGLCVPSARRADQMQNQFLAELQHLERTSPQTFSEVSSNLDKVATETYADLGQGEFGSFSETFQMPSDVDIHNMKYSFNDIALRITLPRLVQPPCGHHRFAGL